MKHVILQYPLFRVHIDVCMSQEHQGTATMTLVTGPLAVAIPVIL